MNLTERELDFLMGFALAPLVVLLYWLLTDEDEVKGKPNG